MGGIYFSPYFKRRRNMNAEELLFDEYKYLIPITLEKMFHNANKMAESRHLQKQDLIQAGRMGLLNAIRTWEDKRLGKFRNFAIRNIRWSISKSLDRESLHQSLYKLTNNHKKDENVSITLISMNQKPFDDRDDHSDYFDIVSNDGININLKDLSVENKVISSMRVKSIWNILTEQEKEMVLLKMEENLSYKEIGERFGVSKQRIGHLFIAMQNKVKRHMGVATV
jgi:RNA polymerase sigma factor (sigma-70 family)